jgi:hypothetical protein
MEGDRNMQARIYQPSKSAMTSGMGNSRDWILEYAPAEPCRIDPLMGWTGSGDMKRQVRLRFETREARSAASISGRRAMAEISPITAGAPGRIEMGHRKGPYIG